MVLMTPSSTRSLLSHPQRVAVALMGLAFALFASTSAGAALREYRVQFAPSQSASATGYSLHIGTASGSYEANFDLGSPPMTGLTVIYAIDLEDSADTFVALRSYDSAGRESAYSNEIRVAAVVVAPPPPPPAAPAPPPEAPAPPPAAPAPPPEAPAPPPAAPAPPPEAPAPPPAAPTPPPEAPGGGNMPEDPMGSDMRLGLTTGRDGLISALFSDGSLDSLTMDSLAAKGDIRPTRCDLDGDSDDDLVIGFGARSKGQVALIFLENGAVSSVTTITAGTAKYRQASGRTNPACGDLDGDGRGEIVIGFSLRMRGVVQIFDDVQTGFAPLVTARSDADGYLQTPVPDRFWGSSYPAIGDLDGDGRGELVIGLGRTRGGGRLVILDDALTGFAIHDGNRTGEPWLRVDPNIARTMKRTRTMPAMGDLDGDGRDEIAVSFGRGSRGIVAILEDAVEGLPARPSDVLLISTGRSRYARKDGATRVAIGNVDEDGAEELVVSFQRSGDHEIQIFDDLGSAMRPMSADAGFVFSGDKSKRIRGLPIN